MNYLSFSGNQDEYLAGDGTWQPYNGSADDCDWQLVSNPAVPTDFDIVTGFVEPGCYPGGNVGVGTDTPIAKLEVINNIPTYDSNPNPTTAWGIHSFLTNYHVNEPIAVYGEADGDYASMLYNTGGKFEARNGIGNIGVYGLANNPTGTNNTNSNIGVKAAAIDAPTNLGVHSYANGGSEGRAWGVYAVGENSSHNLGGFFRSYGGGQSSCFGVVGIAEHVSNVNEIGVYGEGQLAGYFAGPIVTSGPPLPFSDEMFKTDISEEVPGIDVINQLSPKSYLFKVEEFSNFHFSDELQFGLIAQELE